MNIFISWSSDESLKIAKTLKLLSNVLLHVEIWLSANIKHGEILFFTDDQMNDPSASYFQRSRRRLKDNRRRSLRYEDFVAPLMAHSWLRTGSRQNRRSRCNKNCFTWSRRISFSRGSDINVWERGGMYLWVSTVCERVKQGGFWLAT